MRRSLALVRIRLGLKKKPYIQNSYCHKVPNKICQIQHKSRCSSRAHHKSHIVDSRTLSVSCVAVLSDELVFVCFYPTSIQLLLHPLFRRVSTSTTEHKNKEVLIFFFNFYLLSFTLGEPGASEHPKHIYTDQLVQMSALTQNLTSSWIP